ncbi:two-component system response regulator YesN [Paenibacillus sp. BK033]|uniref:response regulator transcription factor n=1 Tax=Paenibacillus sp. BK033 TaxID=2512133 RepID=UPI00104D296A|nr:helix-turn-helix domain-containing protein [Paenibacillus sp. BK033]TCM97777.1 two-component system response regulator YesN [Paenibacillus sp. BK033]
MARLLIVDDEIHSVEGIKAAARWDKLGISKVLTAYDIRQAKERFEADSPIDIMLCDIEMPLGSGLELLAWVRENYPDTESIFLTCHADFQYAKQAIQLGSFDYLLKPIPIPELENVIAKAVAKKEKDNKKSEYSQYGQFWVQHQPLLIERFWLDILNRTIPSRPEAIHLAAEERNIPYPKGMLFVPLLIVVKRWHKVLNKRDEIILEYALRNSAEELLMKLGEYGQLLPINQGNLLAILTFETWSDYELERLRKSCETFINSCNQYFYCDLSCYVGHPVHAYELPSVTDQLLSFDRNNVAFDNRVHLLNGQLAEQFPSNEPELPLWSVLLSENAPEKLLEEVTVFLERSAHATSLDAKRLHQFHHDFLQMVYSMLHAKGIQARQLFSDDKSVEMSQKACRSVKEMLEWCRHIVAKAAECLRSVERSGSIVDQATAYIVQNLDKPLVRDDIAKHVFLNPDYLDRMFKKEMGVSVTEYIVRKRMAVARQLLSKTALPVHAIASQVGFSNFSHFARIFKKHANRSPLEFRHEEQAGTSREKDR